MAAKDKLARGGKSASYGNSGLKVSQEDWNRIFGGETKDGDLKWKNVSGKKKAKKK
jgi:hypothetical protein